MVCDRYTRDIIEHDKALRAAQRHARTCRTCCAPIVDPEGNPGYLCEACAAGLELLRAYEAAEKRLLEWGWLD